MFLTAKLIEIEIEIAEENKFALYLFKAINYKINIVD